MVTMTQLVPSQTPMISMKQEDISGIIDIVVDPCAWIAHQGQIDPHERYDLETVDLTHAYEESGSPLLETPLFDQVVETDILIQDTYFQDRLTVMMMHSLLVGMTMECFWTHLYGIEAHMLVAG
jgi:hypothetical protein